MPDLRYHLISLISVFLALAIGILLGVAMADKGVVSGRVQAEITSIQQQLDRQRREIDKQNEQIADQEAILDRMSEVMISDSLQGQDVALVAGPYADPDTYQAVLADLAEAGANVTSSQRLNPPDPAEITSQEPTTQEATTQLESGYAAGVAREVLGYSGEAEEFPEIVVFVGGGEIPEDAPQGTLKALKAVQRRMFEIWLDAGVRVVGAEPTNSGRTEVPLFQNAGIPSVVNADQPAGRAAVIECATMVDCEGTYGTKDSASEPFPPPS
jgi:Copper transport outer membrane protein, MctB